MTVEETGKIEEATKGLYQEAFGIGQKSLDLVEKAEEALKEDFDRLERLKAYNQVKVLKAFQDNHLAQTDFYSTTGYGYGDIGREKTEAIFRDVFQAEDAIVRPSLASGTHALATVLFALLGHGDQVLAATGHPYDTLRTVVGIDGDEPGNLLEKGVTYDHVDLVDGQAIDYPALEKALQAKPKLVELQRSTGYSGRRAFTIEELGKACQFIHDQSPDSIVMVDNCYGEFTETKEPLEVGADIMAGSLIKNPGGGIALAGGYIAGRKDLVDRCINQLTAPGLGRDMGLTFGTSRTTLQGFFLAPHITVEALKSALLFGQVFHDLGYTTIPSVQDPRSDIIQAIDFEDQDKLIVFVRAIQKAASVGADVVPWPWDMPGYNDKVIMASGGFVDGSSIEVSADGPLRPPFRAYYQGGVVYDQARLACLLALEDLTQLERDGGLDESSWKM